MSILAGQPAAPTPELWAEDVLRGFRIDIWDRTTGLWRSLHERHASIQATGAEWLLSTPIGQFRGSAPHTFEEFVDLQLERPGAAPASRPTPHASVRIDLARKRGVPDTVTAVVPWCRGTRWVERIRGRWRAATSPRPQPLASAPKTNSAPVRSA